MANVFHVTLVGGAALLSLLLLRSDPVAALVAATAAATYVLLLVLYRAYRLTGDALNVLGLSMIAMLLLYPFHALVMHDSALAKNLLGAERFQYFTYGLLVVVPAVWAMHRGFSGGRVGPVARLLERASRPIDDRSPAVEKKLALLMAIGVVARIILVARGTGTHFDSGFQAGGESAHFILSTIGGTSGLVALYLLATGARYGLRRRLWLGLAFILVDAAWGGLFSGSRYLLFVPLLSAAAVYSLVVRRVTLRRLAALIVLFVTLAFPLATAYKDAYSSRLVDLQRDGLSTSTVLDSLDATDASRGVDWAELVGGRFHALTSLAVTIRYTPERHPYLWGAPYALLPLDIAIPRVVWPEKPVLRQFSIDFRFDYFKLDRGSRTSVAPSQLGELWANLSLFGVLLGAWVWGRILRFLYNFMYIGGRRSLFGVAAYAAILPALLSVLETEQVTGIATIIKHLIIWLACAWLLGQRSERRHTAREEPF